MERVRRLTLAGVALGASIGAVLLLTLAGSRTHGPIARVLGGVGLLVSEAESRVVHRVRGGSRSGALVWLEPYRVDPARLRHPDDVLLGAYDGGIPASLEGVLELESAIGTVLPLIQIYTAWGDRPEQQFPRRLAQAIWDLGSMPVVTWEPWLTDFETRLHPSLPLRTERDKGGLAAVARGDYDFYLDRWAADAAAFARPLLLRFAHEMNDPYRYPWGPHNNELGDFHAAWQHVFERFRRAGARNVVWVWSPHVAYEGWEYYYPGDDFTQWVATGVLNYGTVAYWSKWWSFDEIFGSKYDRLASFGKPIMVAEMGSLAVGGDRAEWLRGALERLPQEYPAVRAVLFFHDAGDQTVTYQAVDWAFRTDSAAVQAVRKSIRAWAHPPAPAAGGAGGGQDRH